MLIALGGRAMVAHGHATIATGVDSRCAALGIGLKSGGGGFALSVRPSAPPRCDSSVSAPRRQSVKLSVAREAVRCAGRRTGPRVQSVAALRGSTRVRNVLHSVGSGFLCVCISQALACQLTCAHNVFAVLICTQLHLPHSAHCTQRLSTIRSGNRSSSLSLDHTATFEQQSLQQLQLDQFRI